ncbi:MAG: hypothetical protein LBK72_02930, partial [Bifidobacteriaceae bacterium]|nr:hypothetical protein [Bifidobacteriaceae bacterium]
MTAIATPQTLLDPTEAAVMVDEYAAGATASSLAVKYRVHEGTVRSHARKTGATHPDKVTREVLDQYATGTPAAALADRCGVSVDTIIRRARLVGIRPPARSDTLSQDQVNQIV